MEKRVFFIFALLLLVSASNVFAAEDDVGNKLLDSSYNNRSYSLDSPVIVPESLQSLFKFLFGLSDSGEISFSVFIVLIVMIIIVFSIVNLGLSLVPIFQGKAVLQYLSAGIITLIGARFGVLRELSTFLFNASLKIKLLSDNNLLGIIVCLLLLLAVFFLLHHIISYAKRQYKISDAEETAIDLVKTAIKQPYGTYH